MIELIQFAWSPFCLVQRRILEFAATPFKCVNIPCGDRSLVWRLSRHRYYAVPLLKDGRSVVFETDEDSQVIAKYLDNQLGLGLFPRHWAGVQNLLWRAIEMEIEALAFKLNDVYYREFVPAAEQLGFLRHKERKFGTGCIDQWRTGQRQLLRDLERRLIPYEQMLADRPFLLDDRPRFVDFDLFGMLANFLYSGHYALPKAHTRLNSWYRRLATLEHSTLPSEELHP
ncbi:MAG: glutathione S-transferase C-terminal domain-containing protein [Verrucomicrobia bacterium]|nr:glutathione S-transferase C-terminal domain-containing protein [Verrucomicrobiota bacterium]